MKGGGILMTELGKESLNLIKIYEDPNKVKLNKFDGEVDMQK